MEITTENCESCKTTEDEVGSVMATEDGELLCEGCLRARGINPVTGKPQHDGPTCGGCKQPCSATSVDFGNGTTEFWGSVKTDVNIQTVSDCCEHTVYADSTCTSKHVDEGPDYDGYERDDADEYDWD